MLKKIVFFIVLLFLSSAAYADSPALKPVGVILIWKPQTQFAGFYVAREKGIYQKYGLDVSFLENDCFTSPCQLLKNGQADFATMWLSSAIKKRSDGLNLVNVAQLIQRSALMLISKKSSGISSPEDLQGRKISLWDGDLRLQPQAFFRKYNIDTNIIPQSYTVNLFLNDGVDAASAMWYNEYDIIINSGMNPDELVTFFFSDYGLNFPEDGIYTLEKTLKTDPAKVEAFVEATREGWQYAFTHQEEAVDIVIQYMQAAHLPANRVHQKWMLARMQDLFAMGPSGEFGILQKEDYENVSNELINAGLIQSIFDYRQFYQPLGQK